MDEIIRLPDYANLDNLELDGVRYSIVGRFKPKEFLHRLIDEEFRGRHAFIAVPVRPDVNHPAQLVFYDTICHELESLFHYGGIWDHIVVYERMTPIKLPDKRCGNCRHFCRRYHYSGNDGSLFLSLSHYGYCPRPEKKRQRERWTHDQPITEDCFEWNAECAMLVGECKKLEEATNAEMQ